MGKCVTVLFPLAVPEPFDYWLEADLPDADKVKAGSFVYAPLGKQTKLGVVWEVKADTEKGNLKSILQVKSCPPLLPTLLKFIDFTARYNCCLQGLVLRMVLRSYKALEPSAMVTKYRMTGLVPDRLTPARMKVLAQDEIWPGRASEIAKAAGVSPSIVTGLAKTGALESYTEAADAPFMEADLSRQAPDYLTERQKQAAAELVSLVNETDFNVALLDGVTGSGKTEVYFEAIAAALKAGHQVLVLVPEIALTQAVLDRIYMRFGTHPASWHSGLGDAERRRVWREVYMGRAKLVIGARSALYLPFKHLGLIIVDEEHDSSYKQEEGVIYHGRDMAVARAKFERASIILASATPSLETLLNARRGRYYHIQLPSRPGAVLMPQVDLVDLKHNVLEKGKYLSSALIEMAREALGRDEQVMFYLNRRGYAPLIICSSCGEKLKSPDTDSWLVLHRRTGRAMCHHTGFSMPVPHLCPKCKSEDSLHTVGPGVERVEEEARELFPQAKIEIFSSDTAGNTSDIADRMKRMASGDIDILVGTQMVVKGHNFPNLTFVGVVDGDLGLAGGDLRAGERTYQTLVQVAGRAGRAEKPGRALIQTHMPEHEALAALAAGDRDAFVGAELEMRELLSLPPYGKLAAVIISAEQMKQADEAARNFVLKAPRADGVEILGPSEAPIAILRGRHRRRLLIKASAQTDLSAYMRVWKSSYRPRHKVKIQIDIDPQSFF